jgi:4-hydroxybenzoate polyprenyltransferase
MFQEEGRFAVIKAHKLHLFVYTILASLAMIFFFLRLERLLQLWLLLPGAISLMYVLPLFGNKKRLRDYFQIKIYLIAIIWGMIIAFIPYIEATGSMDTKGFLYFLEKTIFIFAITIPFDIRDLRVDKTMEVNTIPHTIGLKKAYWVTYGLMTLTIALVILQYFLGTYSLPPAIGITIGYLITILFIKLSEKKTHDYYYAGVIDGAISLVAIIGILLSGILGIVF